MNVYKKSEYAKVLLLLKIQKAQFKTAVLCADLKLVCSGFFVHK